MAPRSGPVRRLCALVLALALGGAARADQPAPEAEARVRQALAALASPLYRERAEAARDLVALLPASRADVLKAWAAGDEDLRGSLVGVLVQEGSGEAVALVLGAWTHGGDALAALARQALMEDPAATRRGMEALRARTPPSGAQARRSLEAIESLLVRDEVERLFLLKKSRSGGTGSYRGQYDALRPYREAALDVCYHVLTDRALRVPGTSAVGGFRFLRPLERVLDVWEVRGMALNALLDLALPKDPALVERLAAYLTELKDPWRDRAGDDGFPGRQDPEREAFENDLLAALYRLEPDTYAEPLHAELRRLTRGMEYGGNQLYLRIAAALALRAGLYGKASEIYVNLLRNSASRAHDHYNLACCYASWSLEAPASDAPELREQALEHLEASVAEHWSDLDWMEEDRDLDPIRDTPRYKALKASIAALLERSGR